MNGARDEYSPLAIDNNGLPIIGDTAMDQPRTQKQDSEEQC